MKEVPKMKQGPVVHKFEIAREKAEATARKVFMTKDLMEDIAIAISRWVGDSPADNMKALVFLGSVDALLYAKTLRRMSGMTLERAVTAVSAALPDAGVVMSCETFVAALTTIAREVDAGRLAEQVGNMRAWRLAHYRRQYGAWRWIRPTWWRALL